MYLIQEYKLYNNHTLISKDEADNEIRTLQNFNNKLKYEDGNKILRKISPFIKRKIDQKSEIKGLYVHIKASYKV